MMMSVDKAGHDDHAGGVDDNGGCFGCPGIGANRQNLRAFDQYVGFLVIADLWIERQHDAALEQDSSGILKAAETLLRRSVIGQQAAGGCRCACGEKTSP